MYTAATMQLEGLVQDDDDDSCYRGLLTLCRCRTILATCIVDVDERSVQIYGFVCCILGLPPESCAVVSRTVPEQWMEFQKKSV